MDYQSCIDISPEPLFLVDRGQQNQGGNLVFLNRAFLEHFGEVSRLDEFLDLCTQEKDALRSLLQAADPKFCKERFEFQTVSGEKRWFMISRSANQPNTATFSVQMADVTLIIQRKKRLEESEQRSRAILKSAGLGAWDWYLSTGRVVYDEGWANMLGYNASELAQDFSTWERLVHPEDKEKSLRLVQAYLDGDAKIYEARFRMLHKDEHWIWILARAQFSDWDSDGKPLRLTGTHYGITEYMEGQELNESIQRNANIGGWELDAKTFKTIWTEETYKIHKVPVGTPTDKTKGVEFYAPHERSKIQKYIENALRGHPYKDRFQFIDAEGNWKWVEAAGQPILNAKGEVFKVRGTFQDVTELVEKQLSLENLVESLDDIIIEITEDGDFLSVHARDESLLLVPKKEIIGLNVSKFLPKRVLKDFQESLKLCKETNSQTSFEYRLGDDSESDYSVTWYRCKINPQKLYSHRFTLLVSDITREKRWEFLEKKYVEDLKSVNERLQALLSHSPTVIFECEIDKNWTMRFVNDYVAVLTGHFAHDFISGKIQLSEVIFEEDRERVANVIEGKSKQSQGYEIEYRIRHQDGSIKWVWERGFVRAHDQSLIGVIFDITDKKEAEERLRLTSQELDHFFRMAPDPLCIATTDGHFKKVNPALAELLGYSQQYLERESFLPHIHPDDLLATENALVNLDKGQVLVGFENRFRCKTGEYRTLSWTATFDKQSALIFAVARDLTDVKKAQAELEEVRRAIELSAIVAITDRTGRIVSVNDNFLKISGYNREDLLGQNHRILKSGVHAPEFYRDLWVTISSGQTWQGDITNRRKDGTLYDVHTVISPLTSADTGRIERYLAIRFDVTSIKASERKYREAERIAKMGSWVLSFRQRSAYWSDQMFKLVQVSQSRGVPTLREQFELIHEDDREAFRKAAFTCARHGQDFRMRFRLNRVEELWIEAIGRAEKGEDGCIQSISGTCQEVTELVLAEKRLELEQAKSLQSAKLASLGEMSAGVAHEINNPLAILSGGLKVLTKIREDEVKFKDKLNSMGKAIERISKIVLSLRRFSRSAEHSERVWMPVSDLVAEIKEMAEIRANRAGVQVEFGGDLDAQIFCNAIEIEQVLINLLNNAVDAAQGGERPWAKLWCAKTSFGVEVHISDSGPGFAPESRRKLFQPFYTTKQVGKGTGLGLSIVKGIVDAHDAEIELLDDDSQPTTFVLRFYNTKENRHAV